jgi:hypothetical protein
MNLYDVGVDEGGSGLGLHLEAADVGGVFGQFPLENLERDLPPERELLGQIDVGHRPTAEPAEQAIIADLPSGKIEVGHRLACSSGGRRFSHTVSMLNDDPPLQGRRVAAIGMAS